MLKERQISPVSSTGNRVSPYPLRSSRSKKQKEAEAPPLVSESVSEWEDVRCVICMEPPHNAVLLQCASFSRGCRAYMCDTSSRHSNCFKQYRRNNSNKNTRKTLNCPYCRGEVYGTMKSTSAARRFMNARPRCCSMDKCHFSGTYSQLKTHLKAEHPCFISPEQLMWEQSRDREAEYIEMLNALHRWEAEQRLLLAGPLYQLPPHHHHHHHPFIHHSFDAFVHRFTGARGQASAASYPHGTMYPRWTP
ncbi:hypothetical protein Bca101_053010 [Brassica carinata]